MYLVQFKRKDDFDWMVKTPHYFITRKEFDDYHKPSYYLISTIEKARKEKMNLISLYSEDILYIKISTVNKYSNYKTEVEVIDFYENKRISC